MTFVGDRQPSTSPVPTDAAAGDDGAEPGRLEQLDRLADLHSPYLIRSSRRGRILLGGAAALALGAACVYTALVDPNLASSPYPQCPLKALTDIDCPGCGGLRATNALLHGDIVGAADHNILALVLLPVMAYMFLRWLGAQIDVKLPEIPWPRAATWALPVVLIVFTIGRNVPISGLYWFNSGLN